ncbi:MAG: YebC/PmpR family DNA-binding transcriptional regulator [Oscillospiraceae bacterium]|nr:YebC/PmpR family DNA-binding transcriptional regulator [Oscillospiraceae bacterium]
MSGHSRWNNIKRQKEKSDAKKGKIFTKIGRELAVAVREGGGRDLSINSRLRECMIKAKALNVPHDNIERIIKKAAGGNLDENYESVSYEGYGPGGTAFIVEALTDNRNRTASNLRRCFEHNGGNLGAPGCVSFLFEAKGVIVIEKEALDEGSIMEDAVESGAVDFQTEDDNFIVITEKSEYESARKSLEFKGYKFYSSEISMVPTNYLTIEEENLKKQIEKLIEVLEDDDDVQNVWCNCEFQE